MSIFVRPAILQSHNLILFIIAFIAITVDQITKHLVEIQINVGSSIPIPITKPYLSLTHTQNTGAAFSLFQNGGIIFVVIAVIVSAVILYYTPKLPNDDRVSRIALGLQLGGAIGNVIDRIRQGHVTDFLHFQIPEIGFDWPVFNVADSCIVIGVILLLYISYKNEKKYLA
jgi:signal peptidase II